MIEQFEEEQLPNFPRNSVVQIAFIQNIDLSSLLFQIGFIPHLFYVDGLGWADGFIFKLDRDYFFFQIETSISPFFTEVYTTSVRPPQQSLQILFDASALSMEELDIFYQFYDIQYMSIQNQINLQ